MRRKVDSLCGPWVLQTHDATDMFGTAHTIASRAKRTNYAARYTNVGDVNADGFLLWEPVEGTRGPIGNFICWPGLAEDEDDRTLAQWSPVFAAKITTSNADHLKATPVESSGGGGWVAAEDFAELEVVTFDGSKPAVDTPGLVVAGTHLGEQYALFFEGGSGGGGGAGGFPARIVSTVGLGNYTFNEVIPFDNSDRAGGISDTAAEFNRSLAVEVDKIVWIVSVFGAYYFWFPISDCL